MGAAQKAGAASGPATYSSLGVGGHFSSCPLGSNQPQPGNYGGLKNVPGAARHLLYLPKKRF